MPLEIEAKFRLQNVADIQTALRRQGAKCLGAVLETNRFFDWPDDRLRQGDCGLRIRRVTGLSAGDDGQLPPQRVTMTYKGPRQGGPFKVREEIEFQADSGDAAMSLFEALGLRRALTFEKRRESWLCADCRVEIDELPRLGFFLEIEGPDEPAVSAVRDRLGLTDEPVEPQPYTALISDYQQKHPKEPPELTF